MKWLTIPEIKRRSKTAKGALKVSYEHWCQLYDATAKELRDAFKNSSVYFGERYCGLCLHYDGACRKCPLSDCLKNNSSYEIAWNEFFNWYKQSADWHSWKRACKVVRDKLGELLRQGT